MHYLLIHVPTNPTVGNSPDIFIQTGIDWDRVYQSNHHPVLKTLMLWRDCDCDGKIHKGEGYSSEHSFDF